MELICKCGRLFFFPTTSVTFDCCFLLLILLEAVQLSLHIFGVVYISTKSHFEVVLLRDRQMPGSLKTKHDILKSVLQWCNVRYK